VGISGDGHPVDGCFYQSKGCGFSPDVGDEAVGRVDAQTRGGARQAAQESPAKIQSMVPKAGRRSDALDRGAAEARSQGRLPPSRNQQVATGPGRRFFRSDTVCSSRVLRGRVPLIGRRIGSARHSLKSIRRGSSREILCSLTTGELHGHGDRRRDPVIKDRAVAS